MARRCGYARASLAVPACDDAQTSAMRARYGLTPRRVASSRLVAHERREGLCARTAIGGDLGVGSDEGRRRLHCSAGATAAQVATLKAAGGAMVPVVPTGTREAARARTVAPLPLP
jgi:small ligand-binding sensory domain FIST